jgi:hypothetical protein
MRSTRRTRTMKGSKLRTCNWLLFLFLGIILGFIVLGY